jgi:predicted  nucleic acid-binding Zn-ribbon protein
LQVTITQRYELETSRKISVYEQNMSGLTREVEDLRRRIAEYENALRKKNDEVSQLENRYKVVSQEYEAYKFQVKTF